jgi:hypothetical protein
MFCIFLNNFPSVWQHVCVCVSDTFGLFLFTGLDDREMYIYIYIYIYMCVCVCVMECAFGMLIEAKQSCANAFFCLLSSYSLPI